MTVKITPEDFRDADRYMSIYNCPLAVALKRTTTEAVVVGGIDVNIGTKKYRIPSSWIQLRENKIDCLIEQAKISLEGIPTVELELI